MKPNRFGCLVTIVLGSEASPKHRDDAFDDAGNLYDWARECCGFLVRELKARGLDAINYEIIRGDSAEDGEPPDIEDLPITDGRLIVEGDWFSMEDDWDGDVVSIPVRIRIPLMTKESFLVYWKALRAAVLKSYAEADEMAAQNQGGPFVVLYVEGERFNMARFVSTAPEAGWLSAGDCLHHPTTTSLRQQIGSRVLRDLAMIGRDRISPASIQNALTKTLARFSAVSVYRSGADWILQLSYFGGQFFFDGMESGVVDRVLDQIVYCANGEPGQVGRFDPAMERLLDRLAVARAWADEMESRVKFAGEFHHGLGFNSEKGMSYLCLIDDEAALVISESTGWVSVPDWSDEPGECYLRASGFSVSDLDTILPLIGLDLAEIMALEDDDDLPIQSSAFNLAVRSLRDRLLDTGLLIRGGVGSRLAI